MDSIKDIPAFNMWKMFNDTMPALLSASFYNENNLQRLANIVKSKEFSNIFVYNPDSSLSYQQYEDISNKYKAFTIWLLGQFFNLLGTDRLSRLHDLIIDAKLRILQCISVKEPSVYNNITQEYIHVFTKLIDLHKNNQTNVQLSAFIPQEIEDLKSNLNLSQNLLTITSKSDLRKLLKKTSIIVDDILCKKIKYHNTNNVDHILNGFIYLFKEGNVDLKLSAFEAYKNVISLNVIQHSYRTTEKLNDICSLYEQIIYDIFHKTTSVNTTEFNMFCSILVVVLQNAHKQKFAFSKLKRISNFIYKSLISKNSVLVNLTEENKSNLWIWSSKLVEEINFDIDWNLKIFLSNEIEIITHLNFLEKHILKELKKFLPSASGEFKIFEKVINWKNLKDELERVLSKTNCDKGCNLSKVLLFLENVINMICRLKINFNTFLLKNAYSNKIELIFFEGEKIVSLIIFAIEQHLKSCLAPFPTESYLNIFSKISFGFCLDKECAFILDMLWPFNDVNVNSTIKNMNILQKAKQIATKEPDKFSSSLWEFFNYISCELIYSKDIDDIFTIEKYKRILIECLKQTNEAPKYLTNILSYLLIQSPSPLYELKVVANIITKNIENDSYAEQLSTEIQNLNCIFSSEFAKLVILQNDTNIVKVKLFCLECNNISKKNKSDIELKLEIINHCNNSIASVGMVFKFFNVDFTELEYIMQNMCRHFLDFKNQKNTKSMHLLSELTNHTTWFFEDDYYKKYIEYIDHDEVEIRKEFSNLVLTIFKHTLKTHLLGQEVKQKVLKQFLSDLEVVAKKSLQYSDFPLQDTVIKTIENLCTWKNENVVLSMIKLLLLLIMTPTSKHSLIAVNVFLNLAKYQNSNTSFLYNKYKKEICNTIVKLCAINQQILNYSVSNSLERISLVLGFFGTKDFLMQEHQHLLPFMVPLIIKMPQVAKLLDEIIKIIEQDISDVLSNTYGNVFSHIFLNETDEVFKNSMKFLEEHTGLSGSLLRKRNIKILLNELLVNFFQERDRVLLALKFLAQEDADGQTISFHQVPDYLQPKFFGVLQYFDTKLIANNSKVRDVLLSLAQLIKLMGPKRVTAFRFKIIAMLRTALSLHEYDIPELNCDIWGIFVRTCDLEAIGPQLATIFISILPLMKQNPVKINSIFRFLVIENEALFHDYLPDLFFIIDTNIDYEIILTVKRQMEKIEEKSFKEQLKVFLKYLTHETMEMRVHCLKYLKTMFERNREELDQMILGYNGIDPIIVELLEILTSGCREKDEALKLACAECIGEIGAIEPSHFPKKCAQDSRDFTFYITEDTFVVNSLHELTRALQAEKNTQNMDKYALAIQETLKIYEVSPNEESSRHHLWNKFSEPQKELMLPLLSSRYTVVQPRTNNNVAPIFGSSLGSTFQSWAYNWMCSLISVIKPDKKAILIVYLPSLKQDYRTMMHFLPHILLHSILEGTPDDTEKVFNEMMCIVNAFNSKRELDLKILNTKPLCTSNISFTPKQKFLEEVRLTQCTKGIFLLLDYLERWTREFEWLKGAAGRNDENYKTIKSFLQRFCKLQLAKVNYQCGEYPRALMYLEDYIANSTEKISENLYFLAEIYAQLDEADGVAGITALEVSEPPLEQRILSLEVSGKLADVAACYERISRPFKLHHLQGLIQCYLSLDNVNTALYLAKGSLIAQPEYTNAIMEAQAEPLWRLSHWEELDELLKQPELKQTKNWGVQVGQALLHLRNGKRDEFKNVLNFLKSEQVNGFGASSLEEGAYQHGYSYIAKLHALNELEQVERVIYEILMRPNDLDAANNIFKKLISEWELRIKVVQESVKIIEPILCLRRVILSQAKELLKEKAPHTLKSIDTLLGESWLLSAKTARAAGVHQQAYTYTLKAEEYAPQELFLEKAKLHWLREEHEEALTTLKRGIEKFVNPSNNALELEQKKLCAEAKLLIASYNDSISNVDTDVNIQHYKEAVEMFREWEKSLVCLAQYYDRIFQTLSDEDRDAKGSDMQLHMINYFGKSLQYGTNYVYQSMPRLLSIWFDYGTRLLDVHNYQIKEERKGTLLKMTKLIDNFLERLPSYIFLTAFSQLVSRICHPQKEVYIELKAIIIKLILQYPQQSLWMIIPVIKSSYAVRSKRCAEIFNDSRLKTPNLTKFIGDFTKLAEKLIELCNKNIPDNVKSGNVSNLVRTLPRMLNKNDFSTIMLPTHKFRKLILPNPDFKNTQHNPFPNHYVHIAGIEDEMQILPSLQRPRKIILKGSDGKRYIQMLKPKDDLRKDFRLMEFNDIVNQLLSREAESRQKRLHIRLYSVAPLNEECGLIEWVPNLVGLRPILMSLYQQRGIGMKGQELKENCCNQRDSFSKKKEVFLKKFLPKHPPILGEWFRKTFPDAQSWLTARTAYIRTTAVISMTGYILGLGDRHGENILLDSKCGETVHVDFNCLFNKGETFEWPERVPFRLTHNMVSAMGPLGVEGIFRKSCACTLRVLRTNINTLMSIVTPFVYDPLVSWPRNIVDNVNAMSAERTNEQAVEHIRNIKLRLQGMVRTKGRSFSIPLSVEGQTNNLILEAISVDNLCQMYIGWGPYL